MSNYQAFHRNYKYMVSFSPPTNSITISIIISILWIKRPSKKNMLIFSSFCSLLFYPVLCHHRGVYVFSLQEQNFQCSPSKFTLFMRSIGLLLPGYQSFWSFVHLFSTHLKASLMSPFVPGLGFSLWKLMIPVVNAGRVVHSMWLEHWQRMFSHTSDTSFFHVFQLSFSLVGYGLTVCHFTL